MNILDCPHVSIIIPVYNGADYLEQAISSALAQTYGDFEIIVVNDGSNDAGATEQVAQSFGNKIRYFTKTNGGVASALNYGIAQMQGELFSWLSHDDIYAPNKLAVEVAEFMRQGSRGIIYSDFYVIDRNTTRLYAHRSSANVPPDGMRCYLTASNPLSGCTLLIPRDCILEAKGFDEAQRITQDYDLWFRLASRYPFYHVGGELVGVRVHAQQTTIHLKDSVLAENDKLYCQFLSALSAEEVASYSRNDAFFFYLNVYRRLSARRLPEASRLAKQKCLNGADGRPGAWLRYMYVTLVDIPALHLRVYARQMLFQNDTSWLSRAIFLVGRMILGK